VNKVVFYKLDFTP